MRQLAQLLRALFVGECEDGPADRAWRGRFVAVAVLLGVIIALRRPDAITNPQFYAEDGLVFFPQNAVLGLPRALTSLFQGFPYLILRLIAWLGGLVPVTAAPRVYAASAIAITALGLATFSLPNFRHLVRSDALRVLFAVAVVALPAHKEALLGNALNIGWYIAIWLTLVSLMRLPRTTWGTAGLAVVAAAAVLSTPLALINLPLWGLRLVQGRLDRDRRAQAFALALLLTAAAILALTPQLGGAMAASEAPLGLTNAIPHLVGHATYRVLDLVLPAALHTALQASALATWVALAFPIGLLLLGRGDRGRHLPGLLVVLCLALLALSLSLLGRPILVSLKPPSLPLRYALYPSAMLCLATIIALDALPSGWRRGLAAAVVALLFVWARAASFVIPPLDDLRWSTEGPRLERMLRTRCPLSLRVPLNPSYIPFDVIWGSTYPAEAAPPDVVVGSVEGAAALAVSFTAQCSDLSAVELNLRRLGPEVGSVRLDVFGPDDRLPIASASLARSEIRAGWNTFCLAPVRASKGIRYVAVLHAMDTEPPAALQVLGSLAAAPAGEQTWFAGATTSAHASLRHGCVDRDQPTLPFYNAVQRRLIEGAANGIPGTGHAGS